MAMISCPQCGEQISDRAKECPHCGFRPIQEEIIYCAECGTELDNSATTCPNCGCPVEVKPESPQKVEVTSVKIGEKSKKLIIAGVAAVFVIAILTVAISSLSQKKAAENYGDKLSAITYLMLGGAADAEECAGLIHDVWYNSIYEEEDLETDKYTRPDGYFLDDFNDALFNLFFDEEFMSDIESIESNQDAVQEAMREMMDPPEEYEEAYEALSELYDAYLTLTNLAVDPTGSLQSFTEDFNEADADAANCLQAMTLYIDE